MKVIKTKVIEIGLRLLVTDQTRDAWFDNHEKWKFYLIERMRGIEDNKQAMVEMTSGHEMHLKLSLWPWEES